MSSIESNGDTQQASPSGQGPMGGAGGLTIVTALLVPHADPDDPRARIQLGPLCVAAAARQAGTIVHLVDLDSIAARHIVDDYLDRDGFLADAAQQILARGAPWIGLSTIRSSFRLTLRLVARLKQHQPELFVFLGGPQASEVDEEVLTTTPEVDAVLRGPADRSIVELLGCLADAGDRSSVAGLTWRDPDSGRVVRNPDPAPIEDLDALPIPAYDLHPRSSDAELLALDVGRSRAPVHGSFGRRHRLKSCERLVAEVEHVHDFYDARSYLLTHELFACNSIFGCPDEALADVRPLIELLVDTAAQAQVKAHYQLLLPARELAGSTARTPVFEDRRGEPRALTGAAPRIDRATFVYLAHVTCFALASFRNTCLALARIRGGFTDSALGWTRWVRATLDLSEAQLEDFHRSGQFEQDFATFIEHELARETAAARRIVHAALEFDRELLRHREGERELESALAVFEPADQAALVDPARVDDPLLDAAAVLVHQQKAESGARARAADPARRPPVVQ